MNPANSPQVNTRTRCCKATSCRARRVEIAQKVARLTGLSPEYVERTNLRVEIDRFTKELLRNERRTVGRIDGRFTGIDATRRVKGRSRSKHIGDHGAVCGHAE